MDKLPQWQPAERETNSSRIDHSEQKRGVDWGILYAALPIWVSEVLGRHTKEQKTPEELSAILDGRVAEIASVIEASTREARKKNALRRGISISVKRTEGPIRVTSSRQFDQDER